MANYQIKRTVGEHYEETSFSSAKETIKWLKPYAEAEAEAKAKSKKNEDTSKKAQDKSKSKKEEKKE